MAAALCILCAPSRAQGTSVSWSGKVIDPQGQGVAGARVEVLDHSLAAVTDAQGGFTLSGTLSAGILRAAELPGGAFLSVRAGRLHFAYPRTHGAGPLRLTFVTPEGRGGRLVFSAGEEADLDAMLGSAAGVYLLRAESKETRRTYRYHRTRVGAGFLLAPRSQGRKPSAAAKEAAGAEPSILKVTASGFLEKRFAMEKASDSGLSLRLLPASASLKIRLQDFIGEGRTFRLAFLAKTGSPAKPTLHYVDFAEMAGDSMPWHAFPDSRFDGQAQEAFAPAWSPDGRVIAYEAGRENLTTANSRIYLQPIQGARLEGPAHPATNPRWHVAGPDTSLLWATSGNMRGWADSAASTFSQKVAGGALAGARELLAKGAYNGGLSPDGRYLATAFPWGVILDRQSGEKRHLHVYPGHSQGGASDSVQACNASVSRDAEHPARMLFLDFGVPAGAKPYPNGIKPEHYAQHRMILLGDFASGAPGRIADFFDTPAEELARGNTWDDPEWSNLARFAVATTRDPDGDLSDPLAPRQTQPEIYLLDLVTGASVRILSGPSQTLPAIWLGTTP